MAKQCGNARRKCVRSGDAESGDVESKGAMGRLIEKKLKTVIYCGKIGNRNGANDGAR